MDCGDSRSLQENGTVIVYANVGDNFQVRIVVRHSRNSPAPDQITVETSPVGNPTVENMENYNRIIQQMNGAFEWIESTPEEAKI